MTRHLVSDALDTGASARRCSPWRANRKPAKVLKIFLEDPSQPRYGYEIMRRTGLARAETVRIRRHSRAISRARPADLPYAPVFTWSANLRHTAGLNRSTGPERSAVSRTSTPRRASPTSTHVPPPLPL